MLEYSIPTIDDVRTRTEQALGITPRTFQIEDTISQLKKQDTITISPTGSGKTLTFWMPLLFNEDGIKIIITSLNILGDQNVSQLAKFGIKGINLTGANSTDKVFKEIEQGLYRVIIRLDRPANTQPSPISTSRSALTASVRNLDVQVDPSRTISALVDHDIVTSDSDVDDGEEVEVEGPTPSDVGRVADASLPTILPPPSSLSAESYESMAMDLSGGRLRDKL
ncbi:hypothetical protein D9613_010703 [Agrocybe pediades]|uniref:DEAD/DEAH-box helicase domain-containing protein n=1 Tax=Agrocybe pediades TaxID=84607 RepID=A0A8H4VM25_9AGAR|nr:hypothetical protein D9613_010703 [Agrocybe pediades]